MVRELEREDRIVSFRLTIPDRPGVLGQIATRLGQLGANILEVEHRRLFLDVPAKGAKLDVTVETRDRAHAEEIFQALKAEGYQPVWIDGDRWNDAFHRTFDGSADGEAERREGGLAGEGTSHRAGLLRRHFARRLHARHQQGDPQAGARLARAARHRGSLPARADRHSSTASTEAIPSRRRIRHRGGVFRAAARDRPKSRAARDRRHHRRRFRRRHQRRPCWRARSATICRWRRCASSGSTNADVDVLLSPEARARRWSKWFLQAAVLGRGRDRPVPDASRDLEVRQKLSLFVRSRWFRPPLDGRVMAGLMYDAVTSMGAREGPHELAAAVRSIARPVRHADRLLRLPAARADPRSAAHPRARSSPRAAFHLSPALQR